MSTSNNTFTWPTNFSCSLVIENNIYPNQYNIEISMFPNGSDSDILKNGFKKLKHFIKLYLNNSILIKEGHPFLIKLDTLETTTVQLPEEPTDYILASVLFHKFSSILDKDITITQITVDSELGDRVKYTVDTGNKILNNSSWWNNNWMNSSSRTRWCINSRWSHVGINSR